MTTTMQIAQYGSLDDLLFRGKNKNYGAYELRQAYEHRLRRAFLLFFGILSSIILIVPIYQKIMGNYIILNPNEPTTQTSYNPTEFTDVDIDKPKIDLPKPRQDISAIMSVPPTIVDNPPATNDKTTNDIINSDLQVGSEDHDGTISAIPSPDPVVVGSNSGTSDLANNFDPNMVYDFVTDDPEFPGDLGKYMGSSCQFPEFEKDLGITSAKVVVGFVVNEDGSLSNVHLKVKDRESFNQQVLKAIHAMPRWKAGSNNGHKVKVNIELPVNFTIPD